MEKFLPKSFANKEIPLENIPQTDKILYTFLVNFITKNKKIEPLRHSQILKKVKQLASKSTYLHYSKSTRTFYKKYKMLLSSGYILKVKENKTGNRYNAYIITDEGLEYIQNIVNREVYNKSKKQKLKEKKPKSFLKQKNNLKTTNKTTNKISQIHDSLRELTETVHTIIQTNKIIADSQLNQLNIQKNKPIHLNTKQTRLNNDIGSNDFEQDYDYFNTDVLDGKADTEEIENLTGEESKISEGQISAVGDNTELKNKVITQKPKEKSEPENEFISKPTKEILEFLLKGTSPNKEKEIWEAMDQRNLSSDEKLKFLIEMTLKYGISYKSLNALIFRLKLSTQNLLDGLEYFSKKNYEENNLIVFMDLLIKKILSTTGQTRFAWNDKIKIYGKYISKMEVVDRYLVYFFRNNYYYRARTLIKELKEINDSLSDTAILIELQILLNLKSYENFENLISEYDILNKNRSNKETLEFLSFRLFYEENKLDEIVSQDLGFDPEWQELAKLEMDLQPNKENVPTPARLIRVFTKLIPQFHSCPKNIDDMIDFYLKHLNLEEIKFFYFTPHFFNWLMKYGWKSDGLIEILEIWLKHSEEQTDIVYDYLTIQEEILNDLIGIDENTDKWGDYLSNIRQFREERKVN